MSVEASIKPIVLSPHELDHSSAVQCWQTFVSKFDPDNPNVRILISSATELPGTIAVPLAKVRFYSDGIIFATEGIEGYNHNNSEHRKLFPKLGMGNTAYLYTEALLGWTTHTRLVQAIPYNDYRSLKEQGAIPPEPHPRLIR